MLKKNFSKKASRKWCGKRSLNFDVGESLVFFLRIFPELEIELLFLELSPLDELFARIGFLRVELREIFLDDRTVSLEDLFGRGEEVAVLRVAGHLLREDSDSLEIGALVFGEAGPFRGGEPF